MDLACLVTGSVIGLLVRMPRWERSQLLFDNLYGWLLLFAGVLLANYLAGGYRMQYTYSRFNLIVTWLFSVLFAMLFLALTCTAWLRVFWLRGVLLLSLLSYSLLALFLKLLVYRSLFRSHWFMCRTAILGTGHRACEQLRIVHGEFVVPAHKVVAFIAIEQEPVMATTALDDVPVIKATTTTLSDIVRGLGVNLIVMGFDDLRTVANCYPVLKRLRFDGIEVLTPLNVAETYQGRMPLDLLNEDYLMQAIMESGLPVYRRFKRMFDVVVALSGMLLTAPLLCFVMLLQKIAEPHSPIFYAQTRVGRFGKLFTLFKLRTMRIDAESLTGAVWASDNDPRVTTLGRILRKYRIDELPQLINILQGDMSVVGPRPERPELTHELAKRIPFYVERENIMPGLTGWAQIRFPYGNSIEDTARKLEYDLYYIKHLSFSLDLQIILSTLRIVLMGKEHQH